MYFLGFKGYVIAMSSFSLTSLYESSALLLYERSEISGSCFNFSLIFGNSYFILKLFDLRNTAFSEHVFLNPSILISYSRIGKKLILLSPVGRNLQATG